MNNITIANTTIRQDEQGRYSLNDLHKAAGGESRHKPANWLRSQQTQELIQELAQEMTDTGIPGSEQNQPLTETAQIRAVFPTASVEGRNGGTYVCKELVYAYAMWISPAFHLKVIRAYDSLMQNPAVKGPDLGHKTAPLFKVDDLRRHNAQIFALPRRWFVRFVTPSGYRPRPCVRTQFGPRKSPASWTVCNAVAEAGDPSATPSP